MNRSVVDSGGEVLVVSQFTLYGDTSRGRRPTWIAAAHPSRPSRWSNAWRRALADMGIRVATGRFRALMQVELVNDGPATLAIEV